ncbi:MAG: hypothetical protein COA69_08120 [Robiginitomaculum sp.]|nr:MAG: hypothetical protein COA69_08120 [Robiginitomaculum sp.]
MTGTLLLKNGFLAVACVAGLTLTACASSQSSSRYGSVYDYESGPNGGCNVGPCGAAIAQPVQVARQVMIGGQAVSPGVVYADCSIISGLACSGQHSVSVYSPPAPVAATTYSSSSSSASSSSSSTASAVSTHSASVANCPAGTTPHGDTCMQSSSVVIYEQTTTTGYVAPPTYTPPTTYLPIRK